MPMKFAFERNGIECNIQKTNDDDMKKFLDVVNIDNADSAEKVALIALDSMGIHEGDKFVVRIDGDASKEQIAELQRHNS